MRLDTQTPGGGGGGYSDTFICIRRLGLFFGGFKISIILGVFRKMNILLGMKILWMFFFWVITKYGYI